MFGNDCIGDVTKVVEYLDTVDIDYAACDNWIKGTKGKFKICAKVFATPSDYGIKYGRISKLQICDVAQEHWGFEQCYVNYDRGWDIRPTDPDTLAFLNGLLAAFGDDPMEAADLFWYDVYGYCTEDDFENRNREHIFSLDSKSDAMDEARAFVEAGDYAVVKVISNDDEDIEIVRQYTLCPYHQEGLGWGECSDWFEGDCQVEEVRKNNA